MPSCPESEKIPEIQQIEILNAQQELIDKLLLKGESKPLEGKIETDENFGYIAELVGQDCLNAIAGEIAQAVKKALKKVQTYKTCMS